MVGKSIIYRIIQVLLVLGMVGCSSLGPGKMPEEGGGGPSVRIYSTGDGPMEELVKQAEDEPDFRHYLLNDLFLKANDALIRGKKEEAIGLLEHAVSLAPGDGYLKKKLAYAYILGGRSRRAEELLVEVFQTGADGKVGLTLGTLYRSRGDLAAAKRAYRGAMEKGVREEACVFLADLYIGEGGLSKADSLLARCGRKKALRRKGIFPYLRGKIALERGRRDSALGHFRRALKRQQGYYLAVLAIGEIYREGGKDGRALKEYQNFLESNPDSLTVLTEVVGMLLEKRRHGQAVPYMERLSGLNPDNVNFKMKLGVMYISLKHYEKAVGLFKEILVAVPDSAKVMYYLGVLYRELGDRRRAILSFGKIDPRDTFFMDGQLQSADILAESAKEGGGGDVERFVGFVQAAMERYAQIRVSLGVVLADFYEGRGEIGKAIEVLNPLRQDEHFEANHEYYLASLFEKEKNFSASQEIMEALLVENPDDHHVLNFLGYSLVERGEDMDRAYGYIKKAVRLKPDDGYVLDSLGWYYYKAGNYKKALVQLKKAWALVKNDATINKHLAMVYEKLKSYAKAKQFYTRALSYCKIDSEREEVLKALEELPDGGARRLPASASSP